ncbi:MAG: dTMP kinase [Balneolaceae bacterium]
MLITFEGIDGCGKSTQIELLNSWLGDRNVSCRIFREPGGVALSENIRSLLLATREEMDPVTELLLFSAARSQLIAEKVLPLLDQNVMVILDRFFDSTTAYQGYGRESASIRQIEMLNQLAGHHLVPDITFYLKISYKEARKRTEGNEPDRMERSGENFFEKVIRGFDQLAREQSRIHTLDATQHPDDIHRKIIDLLKNRLS